jgi:hypothetical protein
VVALQRLDIRKKAKRFGELRENRAERRLQGQQSNREWGRSQKRENQRQTVVR